MKTSLAGGVDERGRAAGDGEHGQSDHEDALAAEAVAEAEALVAAAKRDVDAKRDDEQQYAAKMESAITSREKIVTRAKNAQV